MNLFNIFRRKKSPSRVINTADGRCIMLLPNLIMHTKLKLEGKVKTDFETWAKETYGDVKFI